MLYLCENDGDGGNKDLKGKEYPIPDELMAHLRSTLQHYKGRKDAKYYQHLEGIVDKGKVPYGDMKKIKNFFDNFIGKENNDNYILNGGKPMRMWVDMSLSNDVERIKGFKQAKKDAGIENAFIKPHTKDRMNKKNGKPTVQKPVTKDVSKNLMNNVSFKFEGIQKKIIMTAKMITEIFKKDENCYLFENNSK